MRKKYQQILSDVSQVYSDINLKLNIKNLSYLPNWIIFLVDIFVVILSGVVTFILFRELKRDYINEHHDLLAVVGYYLAVNIFFFWVYKTYSGIIRHSSYVDALKLFFSQFLTFGFIVLTNYILIFQGSEKLFLTTASLFNAIFSFCFLFVYRIGIKHIFDKYLNDFEVAKRVKAVIYGTDTNAVMVANALLSESPRRFNLLGFIDEKNQDTTKRILNLPIISFKRNVAVTMRLIGAEALIVADNSLSVEDRARIVDECLDNNFKVYMAPIVSNLDDKQKISNTIKSIDILDLLERKPIVLATESIAQNINDKVILVTGAAGSIGSEIVRQLIKFNPQKIILLDQAETPLHHLCLEVNSLKRSFDIEAVVCDIRDFATLEQIFKDKQPHLVFHAAAYKHVPLMELNPSQAVFTNIMGTKNVADLSNQYGVERFIMVSTDKAVNPSSVMGASKKIAEMYVQSLHYNNVKNNKNNKTKFITTRFGNVLGSNGSVVPLFTKQIKEGGPITLTHPDIIRYFMTIPEACQLVLEACSMGNGGEIFIFDMGKPVKIIDLAKKMIKLAGFVPYKDIDIKIIGLRPGEKLYEELLTDSSENLPTHHEKIMIAQELYEEFECISTKVMELIDTATLSQTHEIVIKMKDLVPEFKSLNSVFEAFDSRN